VATALSKANLTLLSGNVRVGDYASIVSVNAVVRDPRELQDVPLRTGPGATVFIRDVGRVVDGADVVYQSALVNGRRTVYMPVIMRADASTLDVVNAVKGALPKMRALVPSDIHIGFEFDQSIYVKSAITDLMLEGILGALLTGLMVLVFLREWRSGVIVIMTIPFSILAAVVALRLAGESINIMTLGGLALAVGVLVDEATVAIENIHTHLALGKRPARAVVDAMAEVIEPRFLAMLCVLAVFIPSFFMVGIGRALFPPLALAVGFSMIASYLLTATLLPVLAVRLLGRARWDEHGEQAFFARWQDRYATIVGRFVASPRLPVAAYATVSLLVLLVVGESLGTQLFPAAQTGQFQIRIRAPAGTRLARTEDIVRQVDRIIRDEVGEQSVRITLATVGNAPWEYPINLIFLWNGGPQDAVLLAALDTHASVSVPALEERLRSKLAQRLPGVRFSFEAEDIVSQVLNLGSPTPARVTVSGANIGEVRGFTDKLEGALRRLPLMRDVQLAEALDYPTVDVDIDRVRAGQLGVSVDQIAASVADATSSSLLINPNFWIDPKSGVPYRVGVFVPQHLMASVAELQHLPVMADGAPRPLVEDVASVASAKSFGQVDHINNQRTLGVVANVAGSDLGRAAAAIERAIAGLGAPPRGVTVAMRGQIEQMLSTLASLRVGLVLTIIVILLLLAATFESPRDSIVVISTIPGVLVGVAVILFVTRSTLNIESFIGAIMAIGISVANALLLVTFARQRRRAGDGPAAAIGAAAHGRLRPILMTTLAMVAGMIPMALGLGASGTQTAPLGIAVIGGLGASSFSTLFILPAIFVLISPAGPAKSDSLDPDDPESINYDHSES
jgi:multidrug efflux pump subunit AcrB